MKFIRIYYRYLMGLFATACSTYCFAIISEPSQIQWLQISLNGSGAVVTLSTLPVIAGSNCNNEITFSYLANTNSEAFYALLMTAKSTDQTVVIEYDDGPISCTLKRVDLFDPIDAN